MSYNLELNELKLQLKQWELSFFKKNNKKPDKGDIRNNKDIATLYQKYAEVKRNASEVSCKNIGNKQIERVSRGEVWGNNLLKVHSTVYDVDDHLNETSQIADEDSPSTLSYNSAIKKNLQLKSVKRLPVSLKKDRKHSYKNTSLSQREQKPSSVLPNDQRFADDVSLESHPDQRSCRLFSNGCNIKAAPSVCHNERLTRNCNSFLNKPIQATWLKKNEENLADLSDLIPNNIACEEKSEIEGFTKDGTDIPKVAEFAPAEEYQCNKTGFAEESKDTESASNDVGEKETQVAASSLFIKSDTTEKCDSVENSSQTSTNSVQSDISTQKSFPSGNEKTAMNKSVNSSKGKHTSSLVSTNFVRINLQKKVYMRRSKNGNYLRKKVLLEKLAKKGFGRGRWKRTGSTARSYSSKPGFGNKCFKCGEEGHWANKCTMNKSRSTGENDNLWTIKTDYEKLESIDELMHHHHDLHIDSNASVEESKAHFHELRQSEPLYQTDSIDDGTVGSVLQKFGFSQFRSGQKKAIDRILHGKPTLIVLSTGMGKSLCYQLPAYMYSMKRNSMALVVSPLVSLMDDQVCGLPSFLKAACLHSGMSKEQRDKTMKSVENREVDILLISPEAITSWAGMSTHTSPFSKLPTISFVCIDECHCLSEWSHSFRPSYLRICQVLKEQLGIRCLVGLTATCPVISCKAIAKQLGISNDDDGIILDTSLPDNLTLSASRDQYKDEALIELLTSERFSSLQSIIVYCTRRDEAARLSSYLRTSLQNETAPAELSQNIPDDVNDSVANTKSKKRKRASANKSRKRRALLWDVDCYHAGMSSAERRRVQKKFMSGVLRVVVATIAFGMGIDKQDVRAVIHYNMPRSFERYVQEIGRAGRDGQPAQCHVFLDCQGGDLSELSRHIYAKTVDRYVVKQLAKAVFKKCQCEELGRKCRGHLASIPIDTSVEEFDLSREGIETLLCYLELDSLIKVFLPTRTTCTIQCYEGPQQMALAARKCPAVALGLASKGSTSPIGSEVTFPVVEVAEQLGADIFNLQKNLRCLMWDTSLSKAPSSGRSGVTVEFSDVSFLVKTVVKVNDEFLDNVTGSLHNRVVAQERKERQQLQTCFNTMQRFSFSDVKQPADGALESNSNSLKEVINKYFMEEEGDQLQPDLPVQLDSSDERDLRLSIRQFINTHSADLERKLTGRAMARILHGIDSPRYPAKTWGTVRRFWRSRLSLDFNAIVRIATDELLQSR